MKTHRPTKRLPGRPIEYDRDRIVDLWNAGRSYTWIARAMRCTVQCVRQAVTARGGGFKRVRRPAR